MEVAPVRLSGIAPTGASVKLDVSRSRLFLRLCRLRSLDLERESECLRLLLLRSLDLDLDLLLLRLRSRLLLDRDRLLDRSSGEYRLDRFLSSLSLEDDRGGLSDVSSSSF